jgi:hypothetical protein
MEKERYPMAGKCINTAPSYAEGKGDELNTATKVETSTGLMTESPARNPVFRDLEVAENMVVQLLDIAASTADYLSSLAANRPPPSHHRRTSDADQMESHAHSASSTHRHLDDKLKKNGKDYLDTLNQIHSLLLPHAHMVKAYQTESHAVNGSRNDQNMYVSKMELRLAREKQTLLADFLALEQEERASTSNATTTTTESMSDMKPTRPILGKRKNIDKS